MRIIQKQLSEQTSVVTTLVEINKANKPTEVLVFPSGRALGLQDLKWVVFNNITDLTPIATPSNFAFAIAEVMNGVK